MKCSGCGWPSPGHELIDGRCHKCNHHRLARLLNALYYIKNKAPDLPLAIKEAREALEKDSKP